MLNTTVFNVRNAKKIQAWVARSLELLSCGHFFRSWCALVSCSGVGMAQI
jgi:hypothetical protein